MAEEITMQDIKLAIAELVKSQQETNKKFQETDKQIKETGLQLKETDKKVKEAINLFTTQWGKLIESLVEGEIVRLFTEKGIQVDYISTRVKGRKNDSNFEFDIIAYNGNEIVVVEVKTTLKVQDVHKFRDKLTKVKIWLPKYSNHKIHGAIAFLKADEQSDTFSESKGLWVIRATGDSASIINEENFQPRIY